MALVSWFAASMILPSISTKRRLQSGPKIKFEPASPPIGFVVRRLLAGDRPSMGSKEYIGMDVHQATISVSVSDGEPGALEDAPEEM